MLNRETIGALKFEMEHTYRVAIAERKSISDVCITFNNNIIKALNNGTIKWQDADELQNYNMDLWEVCRRFCKNLRTLRNL